MFNKLFTRILDSSIWLEPHATRVVWITLIASMNDEGFAHFSAVENLARRAGVTLEEAIKAEACFMAPDLNSGDPDNEGRRIEKVPGGYMILNAAKYRGTYNQYRQKELTRARVEKCRARKRDGALHSVTHTLPTVTNRPEAEAEAEAEAETEAEAVTDNILLPVDSQPSASSQMSSKPSTDEDTFELKAEADLKADLDRKVEEEKAAIPRKAKEKAKEEKADLDRKVEELYAMYPKKIDPPVAKKAIAKAMQRATFEIIKAGLERYIKQRLGEDPQFTKGTAAWFNADAWASDMPARPPSGFHQQRSPSLRPKLLQAENTEDRVF